MARLYGDAMRTSLLVLMLGLVSGCVSTKYVAVEADSPAIFGKRPTVCQESPDQKLPELTSGQSCMFPVRAAEPLTLIPIAVSKGEIYRIAVPRNQVWYDRGRRNVAPVGEDGSEAMNVFCKYRRHQDAKWFALIAANVSGKEAHFVRHAYWDISKSDVLTIKENGRLALYPNDAEGVPILGNTYKNNSGQIWVRIERCGTCVSAEPRGESVPVTAQNSPVIGCGSHSAK
jgi:hypothetical protein